MKLDEKKLSETCKTILSSADLNTITEKKVRRQVEDELGLEDKILDKEPHKSYIKEIVNKVINDLRESSRSPQPGKKTDTEVSKEPASTTKKQRKTEIQAIKPASTTKKQRKTEIKSKESSKSYGDEYNVSSSKPLNGNDRVEIPEQLSAESSPSKTQVSKTKSKISKAFGELRTVSPSPNTTSREEQPRESENVSEVDDYKSSSKQTGQANNKSKATELVFSFEESESEKVTLSTKTTKSIETNKTKQKSRSRTKGKLSSSGDIGENSKKSDLVLISTVKSSNLEEPAFSTTKRTKRIRIISSDEDEESSSKNEEKPISRKVCAVEDGELIVALENESLAQNSDAIGSKNPIGVSGDDVESDNTIKGEDEGIVLERTIELDKVDRASQNNLESVSETEQEPNGFKSKPISPKRMIDSVEDEDDLSSLEDVEPRKKKGKASANSVDNKTANNKTVKTKAASSKAVNNKTVKTKAANSKTANSKTANNKTTAERDDTRIKNLKSFISKCGIRKNWTKELADCHTDSSKIKRLKQILIDLGIEGRPTLDKCKKVKKRLELEAELKAMDVDNIISDDVKETRKARASRGILNPLRRRPQSSLEYDDSSGSSEDKHSDFE